MLAWSSPNAWFEFKGPKGKVDFDDPDDDQARMIRDLQALGHFAWWGRTIHEMYQFYRSCGVPMTANAEYQAIKYDGMVDSRIAKAEGKMLTAAKSSPRKATPRFLAGKRLAAQMYKG
jgi:hypothetical protein